MILLLGKELVDQWYSEEAKYNYSKPEDRTGWSADFMISPKHNF